MVADIIIFQIEFDMETAKAIYVCARDRIIRIIYTHPAECPARLVDCRIDLDIAVSKDIEHC